MEARVKFLIIRFSSIGDIVLTTPVVRCLKQQVENAEVHFFTKPQFAQILSSNPYIDKVHVLKDNFKDSVAELRDECFDYIIDLHNNLRSRRFSSALKLGAFRFNKLNIEKWLYVNFGINKLPDKHIVDRYLEPVYAFDVKSDNKGLDYFIPDSDHVDISSITGVNHSGFLVLVLGAKHFTKQIPAAISARIISKLKCPVLMLGGKEDFENGQKVLNLLEVANHDSVILNLAGKYSLNQSASIVSQSFAVVTPDTGLMHIAAAFGKNIFSVWGNTVPEFGMYPYLPGKESQIFEVKNLKCRPCSKIGFRECPKNHFNCMNQQDTDSISEAVNRLFIKNS